MSTDTDTRPRVDRLAQTFTADGLDNSYRHRAFHTARIQPKQKPSSRRAVEGQSTALCASDLYALRICNVVVAVCSPFAAAGCCSPFTASAAAAARIL